MVKEYKELPIKDSVNDAGWKIKVIDAGEYTGYEAVQVLYKVMDIRCNGVEKVLVSGLLTTPKLDEYLKVEVKKFHWYSDKSGEYHIVIHHPEYPEGFRMEIDSRLDCSIKIFSWAYGG